MQQNLSIYENRILAFVDILGFKNMVQVSASNPQEQLRLMKAMDIIHSYKTLNDGGPDGGLRKYGVQVTTFSDSAILSYPISFDGGLFYVLLDLIHLQIDLACLGIFIRGGVSVGPAHHDEFNAFGPAMVEAYELESKIAEYPRIILSPQTLSAGITASKEHQDPYDISLLNSIIRQDTDGFYFLDYLSQYQELNSPEYDYYNWLAGIRNCLVYNLNAYHADTRIHKKYLWMLHYWNSVLDPQTLSVPLEQGTTKEIGVQIFNYYTRLRIEPIYPYK